MPLPVLTIAATLSILAIAVAPGKAATNGDDPLAAYHWKARVLLVVAPGPADPKLLQQRTIFRAMKAGAGERDLALVEAIGDSPQAAALRARFSLDHEFKAVLVGKDGGDKLASSEPLGAEQLFPLIDAMPMRQEEMKRRPSR